MVACVYHLTHRLIGSNGFVLSQLAAILYVMCSRHFYSLYLVFPARASSKEVDLGHEGLLLGFETGHGRSSGEQAGFQLALLVSTLVIAIVGGLITGTTHATPAVTTPI